MPWNNTCNKSIILYIFCAVLSTTHIKNYSAYLSQDIIMHHQVVEEHNHKGCTRRYEILQSILDKYTRPFTMLELGPRQGYFSLRAAYEYPQSVFVMMAEVQQAAYCYNYNLLDICMQNEDLENIILLNKELSNEDLQRLSECERCDLLVAFNFFSSDSADWPHIIEILLHIADNSIIEVPLDLPLLRSTLITQNAQLIGKFRSSEIWFIEDHKKLLLRRHWLRPLTSALAIESNYDAKKLKKEYNRVIITDWVPGINLVTFKMLAGIYPRIETLTKSIRALKDAIHSDWLAHNMVIQGNTITLIDCNDPRHVNDAPIVYTKRNRMLFKILDWINIKDPCDVSLYYHFKHMEYI